MSKRKLTYEDFKRYFSNRQKPEEKHQFEKNMMQDAFDDEAFDGLSMLSEEEFMQDIDALKNRIHQRTHRHKRTIYLYLKYAAGIAIIIGLGLSTLYLFDHNVKRDIAEGTPIHKNLALTDSAPPDEEKAALKIEMEETPSEKQQVQKNESTPAKSEQPKKVIDELKIVGNDDYDIDESISESEDEFEISAEEEKKTDAEKEEVEKETIVALDEIEVKPTAQKEPETQSKSLMEVTGESERKRSLKLFGKNNQKKAKTSAATADEATTGNAMPQNQGYTAQEDRNAIPPNNWVMDTLKNKLIKEIKNRYDLTNETYKVEMSITIDIQGQVASITHKRELPENLKSLINNTLNDMGNWQPSIENGQVTSSEITLKFKLK